MHFTRLVERTFHVSPPMDKKSHLLFDVNLLPTNPPTSSLFLPHLRSHSQLPAVRFFDYIVNKPAGPLIFPLIQLHSQQPTCHPSPIRQSTARLSSFLSNHSQQPAFPLSSQITLSKTHLSSFSDHIVNNPPYLRSIQFFIYIVSNLLLFVLLYKQ